MEIAEKSGEGDDRGRVEADGFERKSITCLRFATACGMSDRLRLDLVLNDFVATALTSGVINVLSDGTPWRPLIDVRDMARRHRMGDHTSPGAGSAHADNESGVG